MDFIQQSIAFKWSSGSGFQFSLTSKNHLKNIIKIFIISNSVESDDCFTNDWMHASNFSRLTDINFSYLSILYLTKKNQSLNHRLYFKKTKQQNERKKSVPISSLSINTRALSVYTQKDTKCSYWCCPWKKRRKPKKLQNQQKKI